MKRPGRIPRPGLRLAQGQRTGQLRRLDRFGWVKVMTAIRIAAIPMRTIRQPSLLGVG
jgi:hypothetical protein